MASLTSTPSVLSNTLDTTNAVYSAHAPSNISKLKPQTQTTERIAICPRNNETELVQDIVLNQSFHRIYIFDFDDTIFPTSILQKNIKIWNHTEMNTIQEYQQCNTLYHTIKNCVDYMLDLHHSLCASYGAQNINVVIITNASKDWLDDIKNKHSLLISELIQKLESVIPIISAKDAFEESYDDWYSECATIAKTDCFVNYIEEINIEHKIPVLYAIGDGKAEYEASQITMDDLYHDELYLLHRIYMKSNRKSDRKLFRSLPKFYETLKETKKYLMHKDEELREILDTEIVIDDDREYEEDEEEICLKIMDIKL